MHEEYQTRYYTTCKTCTEEQFHAASNAVRVAESAAQEMVDAKAVAAAQAAAIARGNPISTRWAPYSLPFSEAEIESLFPDDINTRITAELLTLIADITEVQRAWYTGDDVERTLLATNAARCAYLATYLNATYDDLRPIIRASLSTWGPAMKADGIRRKDIQNGESPAQVKINPTNPDVEPTMRAYHWWLCSANRALQAHAPSMYLVERLSLHNDTGDEAKIPAWLDVEHRFSNRIPMPEPPPPWPCCRVEGCTNRAAAHNNGTPQLFCENPSECRYTGWCTNPYCSEACPRDRHGGRLLLCGGLWCNTCANKQCRWPRDTMPMRTTVNYTELTAPPGPIGTSCCNGSICLQDPTDPPFRVNPHGTSTQSKPSASKKDAAASATRPVATPARTTAAEPAPTKPSYGAGTTRSRSTC
jgi:hypothetical protein